MSKLTHIDETGKASMVDVGDKEITRRQAAAAGRVEMGEVAFDALRDNTVAKGDVLGVARVAGICAAKRTGELIPLCHPLGLDHVELDFTLFEDDDLRGVEIIGVARCTGRTGVEMEAMTAVSVAALTVYDMLKAVDREIRLTGIELLEKSGGKSGVWKRGIKGQGE
ncbi:MAG: cyclic pyranopterin monophosphate synthase MoaC [bacterium]|nr:cyclic pyranopterin monophosphate synthase MoaC [bacterium]